MSIAHRLNAQRWLRRWHTLCIGLEPWWCMSFCLLILMFSFIQCLSVSAYSSRIIRRYLMFSFIQCLSVFAYSSRIIGRYLMFSFIQCLPFPLTLAELLEDIWCSLLFKAFLPLTLAELLEDILAIKRCAANMTLAFITHQYGTLVLLEAWVWLLAGICQSRDR
jgi:hypothetical protein